MSDVLVQNSDEPSVCLVHQLQVRRQEDRRLFPGSLSRRLRRLQLPLLDLLSHPGAEGEGGVEMLCIGGEILRPLRSFRLFEVFTHCHIEHILVVLKILIRWMWKEGQVVSRENFCYNQTCAATS